jgi:DNA-binding IclR family transcriptional regulator
MARPAPAANRAIEILNFLTAHPTQSFTLSELAKHLDLNGASAHAVLAVLTDAGYLLRHPTHRTYALGPAVFALGAAALERHPGIDLARTEMRALATELGVHVVLTTATADEIVFLDRAGVYAGSDPAPRVGERVPLMPPLGAVFLAWAGPAAIDAWLARIDDAPADGGASHLRSLAGVRARGYAVGLEVATRGQLGRALIESTDYPRADQSHERIAALVAQLGREQYVLDDLSAEHDDVSLIAAPVFGAAGEVVLALSAVGFNAPLGRAEIDHIGTLLRRATGRVTDATFGRPPT